jgi:hypothetical protein
VLRSSTRDTETARHFIARSTEGRSQNTTFIPHTGCTPQTRSGFNSALWQCQGGRTVIADQPLREAREDRG